MSKLKMASFFAGVGGIDAGFEKTGHFKTIYANEVDAYPAETFEKNFNLRVDVRDIAELTGEDVPDADIFLAGFPCQAFSVAGYRRGFEDEKGRGVLFFDLERLIKEKNPEILFLENVKNLVGHDGGNTFRVILQELEACGYYVKYAVLNAKDYGNIPQNRERTYIVGFKNEEMYHSFDFPKPVPLTKTIRDIADFENLVNDKYYYTDGKYKGDIYEKLSAEMTDPDTVYQWRRHYVRKNMSNVFPTLTANMGTGGHNVPLILTKTGIRKITPHEAFSVQGFPEDFKLPKSQVDSRLYKQAENSVCVTVVERIAEEVFKAYQTIHKSQNTAII